MSVSLGARTTTARDVPVVERFVFTVKKLKGSSIIPVSSTQGSPQPPIHQKEIDKVAELLWEIKTFCVLDIVSPH